MPRVIGDFEDLRNAVQKAVRNKTNERRGEALQKTQEIIDSASNQADKLKQEIKQENLREIEENRIQRLAEANQRARRLILQAREELLDEVWDEAEKDLRELVHSDLYPQTLQRLAFLALPKLGPGQIVIKADPEGHQLLTKDRLNSWNSEASHLIDGEVEFIRSDEPADCWGGLIAVDQDKNRQLDARFSERLRIAKDELRDEIFGKLVGN